jgi:NAD(P)H dehydrogenase (quinone)
MRVLIVHAHPDPQSFNAALTNAAVEQLESDGHEVQVSDLYDMGWNAVISESDFETRVDLDHFKVAYEQTQAVENGTQAHDIQSEQAKVLWADLVIFQFPLWWFGMPAILKGWVDRVWARGFAYLAGRKYDTGMLAGRKALVCVTTGTSEDTYAPDGIDGAMIDHLWPIHNGVFRYTGFDVVSPYVVYMPGRMTDDERQQAITGWREMLHTIDEQDLLYFHPASDYDDTERLKPGVVPKSGFQHR